jgi:hypothetical protein
MGYGQYSASAHQAMTQKRKGKSTEVFTQRSCHALMNPHNVSLRESRDSEDNPKSVGIVFALDVSGSMGEIPARLATKTLPAFMQALLESGVQDPQVLFMGVGHAVSDRAPLQVGQFESTERLMDQWLTWLYLEGGGYGGNESYELAMYFCARHTEMDCVVRRGRRGYLFITGDEPPNPVVSRAQVKNIIGDEIAADIPLGDIVEETLQSYEPFYLIPDPNRAQSIERAWRDHLGDRVIVMQEPDHTSYVAAGIVSLMEGSVNNLQELALRLSDMNLDVDVIKAVVHSLTPLADNLEKSALPGPHLTSTPSVKAIRRQIDSVGS